LQVFALSNYFSSLNFPRSQYLTTASAVAGSFLSLEYEFTKHWNLSLNNENLQNVQEFGLYKPCFKHYLKTNIRSVIKYIPPEDWGFAAALPLETFIKQPRHVVWADSLATNQMTL
jgi:hypothetical protein